MPLITLPTLCMHNNIYHMINKNVQLQVSFICIESTKQKVIVDFDTEGRRIKKREEESSHYISFLSISIYRQYIKGKENQKKKKPLYF